MPDPAAGRPRIAARSLFARRAPDRGRVASAQVAVGVEIPDPFDLDEFIDVVAARRGRSIEVLPIPDDVDRGGICGAWIGTDQADWIFVEDSTSLLHREHIVVHEIGHMLAGHRINADDVVSLLVDLDPATVRAAFARRRYDDAQEREAEQFATSVLSRARRRPPSGGAVPALERAVRVLQPRRR